VGTVNGLSTPRADLDPKTLFLRVPLWVQHAVLLVVTLLLFWPGQSHGLMLYDLGELSFVVHALVDGKVPGTDFVVTAYGPARYFLLAWLVPLFESELAALHGFFLVVRLLAVVALFQLCRRFLPAPWSLVPVAAFLVAPGPLHKGLFVLGSLLVVLGLLRYLESPTKRTAGQLGVVVALVGSFRFDLGIFGVLLVVSLCLSARSRARDLFAVLFPTIVLSAVSCLWLLLQGQGVLAAVLQQIVSDAITNQGVDFPVFPGPAELVALDSLDSWLLWLPFAVYGALLLRLGLYLPVVLPAGRSGNALARQSRWIVLIFGVLTCNQVHMKPEFGHLLQAGPLLYLSAVLVLADLALGRAGGSPGLSPASCATRQRRSALLFVVALLIPGFLLVSVLGEHRGSIYTGSFTIPWERTELLDTEMGSVSLSPAEHDEMAPLLAWIRDEAPAGPLWVPTHQPLLYALIGRDDVSGFSSLVYYADSSTRQELLIKRLEARPPAVVVFVDDSIEGPRLLIENAAPRVYSWMMDNYREAARFGANILLVRKR
jgi:hypothetical protein